MKMIECVIETKMVKTVGFSCLPKTILIGEPHEIISLVSMVGIDT